MKIYQLTLAAACVLQLMGCQPDKSRSFLPGEYVNSVGGEFSKADDTLAVEASEGNVFLIHRRTGYHLIENGESGERQYEREEWKALYDEGTKSLTEIKKGKLITIYPDSGYLLIGKGKYIKK
ncbi:hypothetical protein [Pedobacter frigidisoli]|uniref:hypothetical protein n=1 Tax=Pedobacter frigidisoli TaxID=2530455 RepID=UPI00292EC741|nr:hypothetical protein [Pedobacter frigidisoli]